MARVQSPKAQQRPKRASPLLAALIGAERGEVLTALLVTHPELEGEAERIAGERLSSISSEEVASAMAVISLDDIDEAWWPEWADLG